MSEPLLPLWLRLVAILALAGITVVHLRHVRRAARAERVWHTGHLVMAIGMLAMLVPSGALAVPAVAGEVAFGVCAVGSAVLGAARLRRYRPSLPWFAVAVGHAGMACMFALPRPGFELLVWVLVLCCGLTALGWATGRLPAGDGEVAGSGGGAVTGSGGAAHPVAVRVSLAAMALTMAYLLVAMQLAMPAGHTMPGM
ncbi:DUF5134 domain-containing protein [Actinocatenispora sera]|uniref:DUF5134 domain-containing protein n=1 Tax=Actinocatenispora sera TaxID=390989 RepID=UPI0033D80C47